MPAGIEHPVLGYLSFVGVKFVGYSIAARAISWSYGRNDLNSIHGRWHAHAHRHGHRRGLFRPHRRCGVVGHRSACAGAISVRGEFCTWPVFCRFRIAEWWLLLWIFYDRRFQEVWKDWRTVGLATAWSYALDAPAILGFLVVGKFWVC